MNRAEWLGPAARLTSVTVLACLLLSWPAWRLAGPDGLSGMTTAAVLCGVPGWLGFFLASRYRVGNSRVSQVLLGTTLRMLFVAFGTLVVQQFRPSWRFREFLVWVIVFYLGTLVAETTLLLKSSRS